jgi:F-type H+-transporting ATPase subunit alpha
MAETPMQETVRAVARAITRATAEYSPAVRVHRVGHVVGVQDGILRIRGLRDVKYEELVEAGTGKLALVLSLRRDEVRAVLLDPAEDVGEGTTVRSTGATPTIPAGVALLGRVVDPLGRPLDGDPLRTDTVPMSLEQPAPGIHERAAVHRPLLTGLLAIDAMFPIGCGQRELILGDEGTGKTSLVLDVMLRQKNSGVVCVYVAIGRRRAETAAVVEELRSMGGRFTVVAAPDDRGPALRYLAPYAGAALAEHFARRGEHALVVYDDLSAHAVAWRELALLLRRPPGREAFPGDVFYLHARLLERAAQLAPELGGGSITALPVAVLEGGRLTSYIPTNLISITDGQIVLSETLFAAGQKPAVDAGLSVSRVGSRAQPQAVRELAGRLKLDYASFLELEAFSRLGTRLEQASENTLARGRRIRALLGARRGRPLDLAAEVVRLVLAGAPELLAIDVSRVDEVALACETAAREECGAAYQRIVREGVLSAEDRERVARLVARLVAERRDVAGAQSSRGA